jgi:hypothetical protein
MQGSKNEAKRALGAKIFIIVIYDQAGMKGNQYLFF